MMRITQPNFDGELSRTVYSSPVGALNIIASNKGIRALLFEADLKDPSCKKNLMKIKIQKTKHLSRSISQLDGYFSGTLKEFELDLDPVGTEFQKKAWKALSKIPYGEKYSYSQQAELLGSKKLARAVGGANRKNPISIIVPCHRVIGKSGALTGFAGGLPNKEFLLDLENSPSLNKGS